MSTGGVPADPTVAVRPEGSDAAAGRGRLTERTAWARGLQAPLRDFLHTETGSAAVLLGATILALVWVNVAPGAYRSVWTTTLSVRLGHAGISQDLRHWVNDGLMTLFFFVVGLEARREFDLGELRDRRRLALPVAAGLCGMLVPVLVDLLVNGGNAHHGGWGAAMSSDTAFALGMLALVGRRFPPSLRAFILTVAVVDDLLALAVIVAVFTGTLHVVALVVALLALALVGVARLRRVNNGGIYLALGLIAWTAMLKSGVDPVVVGLLIGLATIAYPASRGDLERATDLFRVFREQPTSALSQEARSGLRLAISPNERWQQLFHPFTSYLVVPLFALVNAGVVLRGPFLAHAYTSAITLGIVLGYLIGKPIGVAGGAALMARLSRGRITVPVGWASVLGGGAVAGTGFTVSLLIATLAFSGTALAEAKLGVLTTLVLAPLAGWAIATVAGRLPQEARLRALVGAAPAIVDLAEPVDPQRDHIRGPEQSAVTLLEYGDLECPYCGQAEAVVRELLRDFGELRYVWRHLPLNDVHPHAQLAAEAAEAAGAQGRFWEMHDHMLAHQDALTLRDILGYAAELGLDLERFRAHLRKGKADGHIAEDVDSADRSGVSGTPTFFINGHRHQDAYDVATLSRAVKLAGARAIVRSGAGSPTSS
jgi:Na+/H+ antiporter NhaA